METVPKWFKPVAILALIWNLIGCAAYLSDVMITPEAIARMSAAQQALYNSRPAWAVSATALAVWGGALGCVGLILRKRWANVALIVSLLGVIVQDFRLLQIARGGAELGALVLALQGLVLLIAVGLVLLGRKALSSGWLT